jgi:hypothetical protein
MKARTKWSHGGMRTIKMKAWRLKMVPWRVCRLCRVGLQMCIAVIRSRIQICIKVIGRIWIRINVKDRFRNTALHRIEKLPEFLFAYVFLLLYPIWGIFPGYVPLIEL